MVFKSPLDECRKIVGEFLKEEISRNELVKKMIDLHESGRIEVNET